MNSMPNMQIIVPSDAVTLRWAIKKAAEINGPVYIRVPRVSAPVHHVSAHGLEFGKSILHRKGRDVSIVATGLMLDLSLEAAKELEADGISASVIEMLTFKPFDQDGVIEAAKDTGAIVTAEEHSRYGGLYSLVSETTAEYRPIPVLPVAIEDRFGETGTYKQIMGACGLTTEHIVQQSYRAIEMKKTKVYR